jgi:histidine triad (HIT) family protein
MGRVSCVFCQIIAGELPGLTFYRDEQTVAIMDLRQPGWPRVAHVLVLPREHVETLDELSSRAASALMDTTVEVSRALRQVVQPDGYSLWQSNGEVAGQEVPHVHVHLLTRTAGDGLLQIYRTPPEQPPLETMAPLADRLGRQMEP